MNQKAKFVGYCQKQGIEEGQAQILYELINQDPLGFKAELHTAWPDAFEAPTAGRGAAS